MMGLVDLSIHIHEYTIYAKSYKQCPKSRPATDKKFTTRVVNSNTRYLDRPVAGGTQWRRQIGPMAGRDVCLLDSCVEIAWSRGAISGMK